MSVNFQKKLDYTLSFPTHLPLNTGPIPRTTKTSLNNDSLRSAAHANESDCFSDLIYSMQGLWETFVDWFKDLFSADAKSDPELLKLWEQVVEKDYDPVGCSTPFYHEAANQSFRGNTIADSLVRAAAKSGITPSFRHILITIKTGAGLLFSSDGRYTRLYRRAEAGEFNSPDTLIITAFRDRVSDREKLEYNQNRIQVCGQQGYPIQNARLLVLDQLELNALQGNRMPASLLKYFKEQLQS